MVTNSQLDFLITQEALGDENTTDFHDVHETGSLRFGFLSFTLFDELVRELPKVGKYEVRKTYADYEHI